MSVQRLKSELEKLSVDSYWCKVSYCSPGAGEISCSLGQPPSYDKFDNLENALVGSLAAGVILDWGETVGLDFAHSVTTGVATLEYHNGVVKVRYDSGWQEV